VVSAYDEAAEAWADVEGFTPDAAAAIDIVQGNDRLYLSNGVDTMRTWNGADWADLGSGSTNAPKATILVWMTSRLVAAGIAAEPDAVYFSDILDTGEGHWPVTGRIRIGAGDGDPIVGLVEWGKTQLVVLKRSSVWLVGCDPQLNVSQFPIDRLSDSVGCVARRTVTRVGNDVWFLSDAGVQSVRRVLTSEENEVTLPLSEPVQDVLDELNEDALGTACAMFERNRFLLAVPTGEADYPNLVLPYNTQVQGWMGRWTGWSPTCFAVSRFGGKKRIQFGQADGRVMRWRDYASEPGETMADYQDDGVDYATEIATRAYLFGSARHWKQGVELEAEFNDSRAGAVSVTPVLDEAEADAPLKTVSSGLGGPTFPLRFPVVFSKRGIKRVSISLMHQPRFRELALIIRAESGKLALRNLQLQAQIEGMDL
jgi:hypothetical protein